MLSSARLAAAAAALASSLAITSQAAATDAFPCGSKTTALGRSVQYCPLWMPARGYIPVVRSFKGSPPVPNEVSRLETAGNGNWFVCQDTTPNGIKPKAYVDPAYPQLVNQWWAYTADDHGGWGWVNEIYFRGGDNNEPDAKLAYCDPPPSPQPSASPVAGTTPPAAPAAPSTPPAGSEAQPAAPAEPPAETSLPGAPGAGVQLPGPRGCIPAGDALEGRIKATRRRGRRAPRIVKVVFRIRDARGQTVSVTVRRRPFRARLLVELTAGDNARLYARVYYRWRGEGRTRNRLISRRITICP